MLAVLADVVLTVATLMLHQALWAVLTEPQEGR